MADIRLTAPRAEVLRAVAAGQVKHYRNWGKDPDEDCWSENGIGRGKKVTAPIMFLFKHNLIKEGPAEHASIYAPKPWQLTEAGAEWLAQHPEEASR
jgi:hypothetical protein